MNALIKGTSEYRQANIKEMQAWSLDQKINHSLKRIQEFHKAVDGKVYVAFSGGKDSTVLLHLVRSLYPEAVGVFSNTTNEFVEILEFVKKVPNIITVTPLMTFNETVKEFGFPLIGKMTAKKINVLKHPTEKNKNVCHLYNTGFNMKGEYHQMSKLADKWRYLIDEPFDVTNKCCDILKKKPLKQFERESGLHAIIGTQTEESSTRKKNWLEHGCNIYSNDGDTKQSRPLSIWTEKNIWEYINRLSLKYSSIYDDKIIDGHLIPGEKRTGCAYCAFGANYEKSDLFNKNRFERLSLRKPKQFKKIMQLENGGVKFIDALHKVGVPA